ncbi:Lignostilbene-alpha,beta-dioxygenase isozyme III [Bradyrhizobium sp. ORS 375]|uniref:carotenoid oxygenase family protein n=1 Tax=Bradyrhizobium sp. (strain ORS 375) TaxID=566679 RepID=UPI0002408091|nr:carotenoid oxygenase family protein [Bradyrhizobium sp. ORS 375]CCD96067.1 Lignostilbene-alpha,beta-dioxygenase isozyme III [Bradyrhizobium sp. ORS 375]
MNEHARPAEGLRFPDDIVFQGYAAPVRVEGSVHDLEVVGAIPPELEGAYYRNSADHAYPPLHGRDIFLNGDGMVHMVRFERGHADLTTRYVRTRKFELERTARRALFGAYRNSFTDSPEVAGEDANTANTSVMWHHGKLYALKESGRPYELDPLTLETRGQSDFGGQLKSRTFTAHPKFDPLTGECIAFAYNCEGVASDEIELYRVDNEGCFTRTERFKAPYCSMVHDFLVSRNYIAFVICPMICDWERVKRGEPYWHWDSHRKTYIGVIPRAQGVDAIRWFTAPKLAMQTHTFNAWEDGSRLVLDHFVTESGWLSQFPDLHNPNAHEMPPFGERWIVDLASEADHVEIRRFISHIGEMPVIDPRFAMGRARHYWFGTNNPKLGPMLPFGPKGPPFTCLGHFDERTGALDFYYAGPDSSPEEPYFVPRRADAAEGDGWLLSMVGRRAENRTDLVILDALHLSRGPVAVVKFPCRVHEGFHGTWVSQKVLERSL